MRENCIGLMIQKKNIKERLRCIKSRKLCLVPDLSRRHTKHRTLRFFRRLMTLFDDEFPTAEPHQFLTQNEN